MTDNENLDEAEGKELSWYAKQRAKYKEELDAKDQQIASLKAEITANKKAYFMNTIQSQWYKGDFNEFADKYAENLGIDEMVALFRGQYWGVAVQPQANQTTEETVTDQQPTIWPKSIIWQNPIGGDQPKSFNEMTVEEMKARGRAHPEILTQ